MPSRLGKTPGASDLRTLERQRGIEPPSPPWEGGALTVELLPHIAFPAPPCYDGGERQVRTMKKRTYNILVYALAAIVLIGCWILFADKPTEAEKRKALEENPKYQQGYEAGYNAGLVEGWEDGFEDGLSEGYEEGFDEGQSEGYDEGYDVGYQEGYDRGYDNGYEDCWYDN